MAKPRRRSLTARCARMPASSARIARILPDTPAAAWPALLCPSPRNPRSPAHSRAATPQSAAGWMAPWTPSSAATSTRRCWPGSDSVVTRWSCVATKLSGEDRPTLQASFPSAVRDPTLDCMETPVSQSRDDPRQDLAAVQADIVAWLIGPARRELSPEAIVLGLMERLTAAGIPIWRLRIGRLVAHPLIGE